MFSFFKINDPSRIIILFIVLLIVRIPFYINGIQLTIPELNHFLIGESLTNGSTLYISLWEDISPLSAWLFMLIHFIFGKSIWVYHVLGFFLMFYQSLLFNSITYRNRLYNDNTYVPSLIYGLLMNLSFGMYTLSPILISTTFILLALNNVFRQVEFRMKADEPILYIGLYLGLATLFYLPAALFGFITIAILLIFSNTIGRRYLLVIYGFALPLLLVVSYYYLIGGADDAWEIFSAKIFNPNKVEYQNRQSLILLISLPLVFFIIGLLRIFQRTRFSNYQMRLVQLIMLWLLASLPILYWTEKLIVSFTIFIPAFAVIITHFFLLVKRGVKAELVFSIFLIGIIYINLAIIYNWHGIDKYIDHDNVLVVDSPFANEVKNKKTVILGDDFSLYKEAMLATPFLDWQLAKETLRNPDYYQNATDIYNGFVNDPPEVIVDLEGLMPSLQHRIIFINENYEKVKGKIYHLKSGKTER